MIRPFAGDTVTVIKDLRAKGSPAVVRIGTKVKNIRLVDGNDNIDCKAPGIGPMGLKSECIRLSRFMIEALLKKAYLSIRQEPLAEFFDILPGRVYNLSPSRVLFRTKRFFSCFSPVLPPPARAQVVTALAKQPYRMLSQFLLGALSLKAKALGENQ